MYRAWMSRTTIVDELNNRPHAVETSAAQSAARVTPATIEGRLLTILGKANTASVSAGKRALAATPIKAARNPSGRINNAAVTNPRRAVRWSLAAKAICTVA